MGKVKDFYTCKKCSTFVDDKVRIKETKYELSYKCPVCGTKNSFKTKTTKKES
jgi:RNase P subunit RPR2